VRDRIARYAEEGMIEGCQRLNAPIVLALLITTSACASLPSQSVPADIPVNASFDKTWAAVVDWFGQSSVPIKSMDRSSGRIRAEETGLATRNRPYATCSRTGIAIVPPQRATFDVLVKGDSSHSSVVVASDWIGYNSKGQRLSCVTTGKWEQEFESAVKDEAESR
jgi:hypothetical protein